MKSIYLFLIISFTIIVSINKLYSQPDTVWTKTLDIAGTDFQHTTDGGYIICGYDYSPSFTNLIKTDLFGDTVWTSKVGGGKINHLRSIQQTSDGGYILGGNDPGEHAIWIIKTDALGDTVWTKSYRTNEKTDVTKVIETSDGGYLVSSILGEVYRSEWLLKTDSFGDSLWSRIFSYSQFDDCVATSVLQASDDSFIFCGGVSTMLSIYKGWIVKLNQSGETIWTRKYQYDDVHSFELYDVQETVDGNYLFSGTLWRSSRSNPIFIKTNPNGHTLWIKSYDLGNDDYVFSHGITFNDEIIAAGYRMVGDSTSLFLMRTNSAGEIKWTKTIPGIEGPIGVRVVSNENFTVLCLKSYGKSLLMNFSDNIVNVQTRIDRNITLSPILQQNYPNPFNPTTTIEFNLPKTSEVTLKVFNILGEEVSTLVSDRLSAGSHTYEWDASNLSCGVYLYRLEAEGYFETRKMILMK